jgi:CRP-like cAMP-binding protein
MIIAAVSAVSAVDAGNGVAAQERGGENPPLPAAGGARTSGVQKLAYLQENELFRNLGKADLELMATRAPMKRVAAGAVFHSPDDPAEVLFILKEGRVRIYQLSAEGRSLTTAILEAGSIFGEMALLGQQLHDSFAEALDPCLICLMSREDVRTMLMGDPRISSAIIEILGKRLLEAQEALSGIVFKRTPERLAALLLRRATPARGLLGSSLLGGGKTLEVRHTHEELADMLGAGRETVTKVLNEWAQAGLVELGRGRVRLINPAALRELE